MLLVRWPLVPTTFAGFPPPVNHYKGLMFKHERLVPKNVNTEPAHVCESHISLAARGPAVKCTFLIFLFSHANSKVYSSLFSGQSYSHFEYGLWRMRIKIKSKAGNIFNEPGSLHCFRVEAIDTAS